MIELCRFVPADTPGRYFCPVCDPAQRFTVGVAAARRVCGNRPATQRIAAPPKLRESLSVRRKQLAEDRGRLVRGTEEIALAGSVGSADKKSAAETRRALQVCGECDHLGTSRFGMAVCGQCTGCAGKKPTKFLERITRLDGECPAGRWFPPIRTRHLAYWIYPRADNAHWRRNVEKIVHAWPRFNGRRVIGIAAGDGLADPAEVQAAFPGDVSAWIVVPNDPAIGEVAGFDRLMQAVLDDDPMAAVFYAHTKGVSYTAGPRAAGTTRWRNMMYRVLLADRFAEAMAGLESHMVTGTTKVVWGNRPAPYPTKLQAGQWHFAGTFFWVRSREAFRAQVAVPQDYYGAEAWPSLVCPDPRRALSLFQPWGEGKYPNPSPYDPAHYPAIDRE